MGQSGFGSAKVIFSKYSNNFIMLFQRPFCVRQVRAFFDCSRACSVALLAQAYFANFAGTKVLEWIFEKPISLRAGLFLPLPVLYTYLPLSLLRVFGTVVNSSPRPTSFK